MRYKNSNSNRTQMARKTRSGIKLSPGYKAMIQMIADTKKECAPPYSVLDYGAGRCECAEWLTQSNNPYVVDTFEPNPIREVTPDYTKFEAINKVYDMAICDYVLNVVTYKERLVILTMLKSIVYSNGLVLIGTRGNIRLGRNIKAVKYEDGFLLGRGQFQASIGESKMLKLSKRVGFELETSSKKGDNWLFVLRRP